MKNTVATQNGLYVLIRNGIAASDYGFGQAFYPWSNGANWRNVSKWETWSTGYYHHSVGFLDYDPIATESLLVITELSELLTGGRLKGANFDIIKQAFEETLALDGFDIALRVATQLIVTSPEFHSTNLVKSANVKREPATPPKIGPQPYKAVIYLHLFGGMDSFYMLAPHPEKCSGLYDQYKNLRQAAATLDFSNMVEIDATGSPGQPCSHFGLNKNLPILKEIYDNGDGMFFANTGHLSKPVDKFK